MAAKKTSTSKASGKAASKKHKTKAAPQTAAIKKPVVKKAAIKKATVRKSSVKKAPTKKTFLKTKGAVKKTVAKKSPSKAAPPKKGVGRKAVNKTAIKTSSVKKAVAQKTLVSKTPAPKTPVSKLPAKKTAVVKPVTKTVIVAGKSLPVARKAAPPTSGNGKMPTLQNRMNMSLPVASPLKAPVRQPASIIPRTKTAKTALPNLTASPRVPVRATIAPRKAARSAARGKAPASILALEKTCVVADDALSEQKLREHMRTAVLYLEAWLRSSGAEVTPVVADLAAPAEAARAQIWRWLDQEARFEDGGVMTPSFFEEALHREMELLRKDMGPEAYDGALFVSAEQLLIDSVIAPDFADLPSLKIKLQD